MTRIETTREEWLQRATQLLDEYCFSSGWYLGPIRFTFEFPIEIRTYEWLRKCPDGMDHQQWFACCPTRWSDIQESMYGACRTYHGGVEIYINPDIDDGMLALEILTHELVHVIAGCRAGHAVTFLYVAAMVGLRGDVFDHYAGDELHDKLTKILKSLGPYPED